VTYTEQELADKIDHEGGMYSAIIGYRIYADEVPYHMQDEWSKIRALLEQADELFRALDLPEPSW